MATKKVKLNKNARAWIWALRSGKYKQTTGILTQADVTTGEIVGNCCLGVGCELALKAGIPMKVQTSADGVVSYDSESKVLPPVVLDWLGLNCAKGIFNKGDRTLTSDNDGGKSFKQIARIIEQKAAELFV